MREDVAKIIGWTLFSNLDENPYTADDLAAWLASRFEFGPLIELIDGTWFVTADVDEEWHHSGPTILAALEAAVLAVYEQEERAMNDHAAQFAAEVAIPAGVLIGKIKQHAEADETYALTPQEGLLLIKFLRTLAAGAKS